MIGIFALPAILARDVHACFLEASKATSPFPITREVPQALGLLERLRLE